MNPFVIQTSALSLGYQDKLALDSLTFAVERGGVHALVGANGAGKSSLFRVLLGFETPCTGSANILGCDSRMLTPALRARIGFVSEDHTLPDWLRVDELCALQRRQYPAWNDRIYQEVLGNFHVRPAQKAGQLSRGERAGVNLAMALAQDPELLILDEPTLGLDIVAKNAFLQTLLEARSGKDMTVLYCSHHFDEIERIADRIIVLDQGSVLLDLPPEDITRSIRLWMVDTDAGAAEIAALPGLLELQRIDGMLHLVAIDEDGRFSRRLDLLQPRSVRSMPIGLDRAVAALLAHSHLGKALNKYFTEKQDA